MESFKIQVQLWYLLLKSLPCLAISLRVKSKLCPHHLDLHGPLLSACASLPACLLGSSPIYLTFSQTGQPGLASGTLLLSPLPKIICSRVPAWSPSHHSGLIPSIVSTKRFSWILYFICPALFTLTVPCKYIPWLFSLRIYHFQKISNLVISHFSCLVTFQVYESRDCACWVSAITTLLE